jgi:hypothetical protein
MLSRVVTSTGGGRSRGRVDAFEATRDRFCTESLDRWGEFVGGGPGGGGGSGIPGSHPQCPEGSQTSDVSCTLMDVPFVPIAPVDAALLDAGGFRGSRAGVRLGSTSAEFRDGCDMKLESPPRPQGTPKFKSPCDLPAAFCGGDCEARLPGGGGGGNGICIPAADTSPQWTIETGLGREGGKR